MDGLVGFPLVISFARIGPAQGANVSLHIASPRFNYDKAIVPSPGMPRLQAGGKVRRTGFDEKQLAGTKIVDSLVSAASRATPSGKRVIPTTGEVC